MRIRGLVLAFAFLWIALAAFCREPSTEDFIAMVDHNPELKALLLKSIEKAKAVNPDPESNPAQTLDGYYDFLDWAAKAMPWNILPSAERANPKLYERIDQSLDYFYFILDQPLEELEGKGYYNNSLQYFEPLRTWMMLFTKRWGEYLSTPASWNDSYYKQALADERFGLQRGWYEGPENWKTFNDFFARRLKSPDARPIASAEDDSVVVSPADSVPQGLWRIDAGSNIVQKDGVQIKSTVFNSIKPLLGKGCKFQDAFANGVLTHTFLDVNDYHRYHFPVSGTVVQVGVIEQDDAIGGMLVWDPKSKKYVLQDETPGWQSIETRGYVIVDTGKYGLVAILPIGMSQVSSVNFEKSVAPGAKVKKGDMLGYFLFGGSDIVMLFQKGAAFEMSASPLEHLYMGNPYGRLKGD